MDSWRLFLDDDRYPSGDDLDPVWMICRNVDDALWFCYTYGLPYQMSLDHDLGYGKQTGMDFVKSLCNMVMDNNLDLRQCRIDVHSMNPVGAANMRSYLTSFLDTNYS